MGTVSTEHHLLNYRATGLRNTEIMLKKKIKKIEVSFTAFYRNMDEHAARVIQQSPGRLIFIWVSKAERSDVMEK